MTMTDLKFRTIIQLIYKIVIKSIKSVNENKSNVDDDEKLLSISIKKVSEKVKSRSGTISEIVCV